MLRVLRHYLPLRKGLLVLSETVLLTVVLAVGMSLHLRTPKPGVIASLARAGMSVDSAIVHCVISAFLTAVLSQIAISFNELYDFRISNSRYDRSARFVASAGSATAVALGTLTLARLWGLERVLDFPGLAFSAQVQTLVFTLLVGFGLLWFWRYVFHFALHRWSFDERVLILGTGNAARDLDREISRHPDEGYRVIGLLPQPAGERGESRGDRVERRGGGARPAGDGSGVARELPGAAATALMSPRTAAEAAEGNGNGHAVVLEAGPRERLFQLVQRLRVDIVVVALEDMRGSVPTEELLSCRLHGVAVEQREALYERITGKIAVEALRPSYLIFNEGFGRSPWTELAKRTCDVAISLALTVLTWPLMLLTALAVRLNSEGPVLFRQERVGQDGEPFTLLKFRSMRVDAERGTGPVWAQTDDPRITGVGRFIRKTRLDELPQLLNVLLGHMSLVGPRPERPVFVEDLATKIPYYKQRHIVKPGLTGWAQINYPYGNTVEDALQKLQYDLFYIKNHSLLFDLSILFNTIKIVLLRKGT